MQNSAKHLQNHVVILPKSGSAELKLQRKKTVADNQHAIPLPCRGGAGVGSVTSSMT